MFQKMPPSVFFHASVVAIQDRLVLHMAVCACILLLNEFWSFASGLDYKAMMSGEDPLSVLQPVLLATNVHVVAKLANKIPSKVCILALTIACLVLIGYTNKHYEQEI